MRVDIEHVQYIIEECRKINSLELDEITFYHQGEEASIPDEVISEFKYTGLSNTDFIQTEYYLKKGDEEDKMSITDQMDRDDHWFHDPDMGARG